ACTSISAVIGATSLCWGGTKPWDLHGSLWFDWWLGDMMGAILVAPAIMAWLAGPRFHWSLARFIHGAALLAVVAAVSLILFTGVLPRSAAAHPFELAVFPCIIWSALTFGVRGATAITLVVAGISIYGTTHHLGPFTSSATQATPHMNLILLLLFLAVVAVTG